MGIIQNIVFIVAFSIGCFCGYKVGYFLGYMHGKTRIVRQEVSTPNPFGNPENAQ